MRRYFFVMGIFLYGWGPSLGIAAEDSVVSVVVRPVLDQNADETSQMMSEVLRGNLSENPRLYVVDPQKVEMILQYYPMPAKSEEALTAADYVQRGKEHYFNFDYTSADAELRHAIGLFEENPDLVFEEGESLFDARLTLGLVCQAKQREDLAQKEFQEVLRLSPNYQMEAKSFPPTVVRLFETSRLEKKTGKMRVETDPRVAEVYLNGLYQGVTPLTLNLPEGEYALLIRTNHYKPYKQWVTLPSQGETAIRRKLLWDASPPETQNLSAEEGRLQIAEGIRIANLLKADKVVLVDVDDEKDQGHLMVRTLDRQFRASHQPVLLPYGEDRTQVGALLPALSALLAKQLLADLYKHPQVLLDPDGIGDPVLLGRREKKRIGKKWLWSGVGVLTVGGVVGGVLAATADHSPQTGAVTVRLK